MIRYWTSDLHFGHANIIKYCNRPISIKENIDENNNWLSREDAISAAIKMDDFLLKKINSRVKPEDIVCHVGDFMNRGKCKSIQGTSNKFIYYLEDIGNTVSNTIPIAMKEECINKKKGNILLAGFGVGYSWGGCVLQ